MQKNLHLTFCAVIAALAFAGCDAGTSPAPDPAVPDAMQPGPPIQLEPGPLIEGDVDLEARAELAAILRERDGFERARLLAEHLSAWNAEQAVTARALLEDESLNFDPVSYSLLVRAWATYQPAEATRWALARAHVLHRGPAVLEASTQWAMQDPQTASLEIETLRKNYGDMSELLLAGLVRGWYASGDLAGLDAYMIGRGPGLERQRVASQYVRSRLQYEDPEVVMAWAEALPEDDATFKQTAYRQLASNLPLFDFPAALRWCKRHCNGPYGDGLRSIIARRWVRTDGGQALIWLAGDYQGIDVDRDLDLGLRLAFGRWGSQNRAEALEWAGEQVAMEPIPPWMAPITPLYVRMIAAEAPLDAIALTQQQIADESERELILVDIAREWLAVDPAAAEAWLASSELSEEARAEAHQPNKRRPAGF